MVVKSINIVLNKILKNLNNVEDSMLPKFLMRLWFTQSVWRCGILGIFTWDEMRLWSSTKVVSAGNSDRNRRSLFPRLRNIFLYFITVVNNSIC